MYISTYVYIYIYTNNMWPGINEIFDMYLDTCLG